jgi:hypothetical protein
MANTFIAAKGCVYIAGSNSSKGFYQLSPPLRGTPESPILLEGVDATLQDIVFPVATLDDKKYLYTMGDDFGNVGINGMILLGSSDAKGGSFAMMKKYFDTYRSSARKTPIKVSCPGSTTIVFYLTSLVISKADPEFHIQFFQMRGISVEPKKA